MFYLLNLVKFAHSFTFSPTFIGYIKIKYADKHAKGMHFIGKNATKRTYNLEYHEKLSAKAGSEGIAEAPQGCPLRTFQGWTLLVQDRDKETIQGRMRTPQSQHKGTGLDSLTRDADAELVRRKIFSFINIICML